MLIGRLCIPLRTRWLKAVWRTIEWHERVADLAALQIWLGSLPLLFRKVSLFSHFVPKKVPAQRNLSAFVYLFWLL